MKNIEVELRSFITKEKYLELLEFFNKNAKLIKEDNQETHYFDIKEDLRIQKSDSHSKIWLKKGKIHDDCREEIEIKFPKEDFTKLKNIFERIDFKTKIKWFRKRHEFNWNNIGEAEKNNISAEHIFPKIKVCLDFTKGYGYILELEIFCSEEEKQKALKTLEQKFNKLNIPITPKQEFENKFKYYEKNWRKISMCRVN